MQLNKSNFSYKLNTKIIRENFLLISLRSCRTTLYSNNIIAIILDT